MKFSMASSPLRPLSVHRGDRLQQLIDRERAVVFFSCGVLLVLAIAEGISALLDGPRLLVAWIMALLATAGYDLYHLRFMRQAIQRFDRESLDEDWVRARLSAVGVLGARVFMQVPCDRQTVPAIVIAPQGVFALEVLIADPVARLVAVAIDAKRLRYGGVTVNPNPMAVLNEHVESVQKVLRIGRNDDVVVRPVIVVAGAAIEVDRHNSAADIPVVSAESLAEYINSQPEELAFTEVTMHAMRLAAHIESVRAGNREPKI